MSLKGNNWPVQKVIIVSNRNGHYLDATPATIEALPEEVKGQARVFIDGEFRRDTNVFKALALGSSEASVVSVLETPISIWFEFADHQGTLPP